MVSSNTLVSVIITTYNRKKLIKRAIDSVINQDYENIEIIVIDDCSNYNIHDHLSEYNKFDITILKNNSNKGANWSRKRGIKTASGRYIAFLDDDDYWMETKIKKQVNKLEKNEDVGFIATGRKNLESLNETKIHKPKNLGKDVLIKKLLCNKNPIGGFSTILVDQTVIQEAGFPDKDIQKSQDVEWYIRLLSACEFNRIPEPLVLYDNKQTRDRITNADLDIVSESHQYIINKHKNKIRGFGYIFSRKVKAKRFFDMAKVSYTNNKFSKCFYYSLKSIFIYPHYMTVLLIVLSMFGNVGKELLSILNHYRTE